MQTSKCGLVRWGAWLEKKKTFIGARGLNYIKLLIIHTKFDKFKALVIILKQL